VSRRCTHEGALFPGLTRPPLPPADVIAKSKDAKKLAQVMEERTSAEDQLKGLQGILRSSMEELDKYKKLVHERPEPGQGAEGAATGGSSQAEVKERMDGMRAEVRRLEGLLTEVSSPPPPAEVSFEGAEGAAAAPAPADPAAAELVTAQLAAARAAVAVAEEAASDSASAAVKATRAREKLEREQKEKLNVLETALAAKTAEAAALTSALEAADSEHAAQIATMSSQISDMATARADAREKADSAADTATREKEEVATLKKLLREREEELKKAGKSAEDELKKKLKEKEDESKKAAKEKDDESKKAAKEKEDESKKAAKEKEEEFKKTLKEREEQMKALAEAAKDAASGKELAIVQADAQRKLDAAQVRPSWGRSPPSLLSPLRSPPPPLQMAVKQLTVSTSEMQRERDDALADTRALRDKLIKREAKLTIVTQERADAAAQVAELSSEVKSLSKRAEKAKAANKVLEREARDAKAEAERSSEGLRKAAEARSKADYELASTKTALAESSELATRVCADLDAAQAELDLRGDALSRYEEAVSAAQGRTEEVKAEHAIASRLVKLVNRELKAQLNAETRRVAKLERELAQAQKAMLNAAKAGVGAGTLPPASPQVAGAAGPAGGASPRVTMPSGASAGGASPSLAGSSGSSGGGLSMNPFDLPAPTPPRAPPSAQGRPAGGAAGAGVRPGAGAVSGGAKRPGGEGVGGGNVMDTVSQLGTRLRDVLAEAEFAKEKCRMLEGIVGGLTQELDEKKATIRRLGGGPTGGASGVAVQGSGGRGSGGAAAEAAASGAGDGRLKRDMRALGLGEVIATEVLHPAEVPDGERDDRGRATTGDAPDR
jgi:hypothetical protein